ncbi:hypothetical protein POW79_18150 [Enterobacter quasiroggenkampii]|uniref:hypothetical protein n=1 Tax=Enterobacter TaxID=547 RepID=UPI0014235CC2|nr:hypothetical protein [Enterobacter sp. Acro-832]NIG42436.1 hypothetical protein [Enterobacter sp. Acro-832]
MAIDIVSEELSFFKSATTRMRWLVNSTVLISALIMVHIYLANFSLQDQQLEGVVYNRFINQLVNYRQCQGEIFVELVKHPDSSVEKREQLKNIIIKNSSDCRVLSSKLRDYLFLTPLMDIIKQYSRLEYEVQSNEHTLASESLPTRTIPLLNMNIPANDFVIIMAILSMFIVIGIWMNLRGIHAALSSLCSHGDIDVLKVAQLNTVFLTYSEVGGNRFARQVRALSMWLPFISIVSATIVGYWPILHTRFGNDGNRIGYDYYFGSDVVIAVFLGLSIVISCMHCWIAIKCYKEISGIDSIFERTLRQVHHN